MKTLRLRFGVLALLAAVVLAGCGNGNEGSVPPAENEAVNENETADGGSPARDEADPELVTVTYAPLSGVSGLAVYFGDQHGIFEEEGLNVEFATLSDPIAGLASNEVDVVDVNTTSAIVSAGRGAPIKIVSSMFRTKGPFYLIGHNDIESVEDLAGKTVGAAVFGSGLNVYAETILEAHGLSADDVTLIANGVHESAFASLESGQVDATIIHEPFASRVELTGEGRLLATGWEYLPNFHTGVLAASDRFIENSPETLEKLLRAYFRSQQYAKDNLEEFKEFYLDNVTIEPDVLDMALEREWVLWENNPDVDREVLMETQQIQIDRGFQEELYDLDNILDLRFIPDI